MGFFPFTQRDFIFAAPVAASTCQDVLVLLSALDRQAEDLSVTLVLAARPGALHG
jgi:hypothetical protein